MATVVDQAKQLAKHVRAVAADARRIRFSPPITQATAKTKPEVDRIEFRRRGV